MAATPVAAWRPLRRVSCLLCAERALPCPASRFPDSLEVSLAMSIAIADHELQQSVEPGTPSTRARLNTIAAAREAGFAPQVFLMPVLPHLTDSVPQLTRLLYDIREAGASSVMYGPLHLRSHVKPWFFEWLEREQPDLVPAYRALYPGASARAPQQYRMELAARIRPIIKRFGLERRHEDRLIPTATVRQAATQAPGVPIAPTLF